MSKKTQEIVQEADLETVQETTLDAVAQAPPDTSTPAANKASPKKKAKYQKAQLLNSKVFAEQKDLLSALIGEAEQLTLTEAKKRIDAFTKGKVK